MSKLGYNPQDMDLSVDPGKDFYQYANGTWQTNTKIPADKPRWGQFMILREQNLQRVHDLLKQLADNVPCVRGSIDQKLGDFFASGMNEANIEKQGIRGIVEALRRISGVYSTRQLSRTIAYLHMRGCGVFFDLEAYADYKDTSQVIAHASQGGLGLPERDYYLNADAKSVETRAKYVEHVQRMFVLLGFRGKRARQAAEAVMRIETRLAEASMTNVELRDPEKTYHKMATSEMQALIGNFNLKRYLKYLGRGDVTELNVAQPEFFKSLNQLFADTPVREVRDYLRWHLVHSVADYLPSAFVKEDFAFYGRTLSGTAEMPARWKQITGVVSGYMGEAVGEKYVELYFPPAAKQQMLELVEAIREALRDSISNARWLSDATRSKALAKLNAFGVKIGYPDVWRDYSALSIDQESFVGNILRARVVGARRQLAKIGKPVDRNEWFMSPQTVNAYYSPQMNEIVFPAGILQAPFFDYEAPAAANFGGIGMVIAHEMTHGFDDHGSQFDAQGNLSMWWSEADRKEFEARVANITEQYGNYRVSDGTPLSGGLVTGEAAADLGGASLAYRAFLTVMAGRPEVADANGFTPKQVFFLALAQIWQTLATPEYERQQAKTDPHPPGKFRVNGTLANMSEFTEAFGLPDDCPMMLPVEKRCKLW